MLGAGDHDLYWFRARSALPGGIDLPYHPKCPLLAPLGSEPATIDRAEGDGQRGTRVGSFNNPVDFLKLQHIFNHMVESQMHQLDGVFHALGDATRRRMLRELAEGERTVGQLAEPF